MSWRLVRAAGVLLALSLMLGELWRSWGAGRPLVFVLDDFVFGLPLLVAAILGATTPWRRAFLAAAWGGNVGMLYGSFFTKVVEPGTVTAGNWNQAVLTGLIGVAFVVAIAGLAATLALPRPVTPLPDARYAPAP